MDYDSQSCKVDTLCFSFFFIYSLVRLHVLVWSGKDIIKVEVLYKGKEEGKYVQRKKIKKSLSKALESDKGNTLKR